MPIPRDDTLHVWQVALGITSPSSLSLLSAEERSRAARFSFTRGRDRYVAGRAALRAVLGGYLERDPANLLLEIGEHGRPALSGVTRVEFNITHSEDLALIAITARGPVGVDVESLRTIDRALDLARRYLHPNELALVEAAPPAERSTIFLTCWTRKEAVLKSTGVGLTRDTRLLDVGATTVEKRLDLPGFPPLRVTSFAPQKGFIAACATAPAVRAFELLRFDPA